MASVMAAHFKPYGWICRAVGLFFVQGLQSKSVRDVRVSWKTWYALYSVVCLLCFAAGEAAVAVSNVRRIYFKVRSFTKSMILVIFAVMVVKVTVNVATAFIGSRGMAAFFRKSAEYEKRTAFTRDITASDPGYRIFSDITHAALSAMTKTKCHYRRFFFVVTFFAHIVVSANLSARAVDVAGDQFLQFTLKAGVLLFNSLCFVYDVLHFVALRPCCEVLLSYIRHQHDTLKAMLVTGNAAIVKLTGADDNGDLEMVRVNLCSIAELKKLLNDVWQYSIVASATVVLIITCVCTYCLFDEGISTEQLLLTMSYCFYSAVDFADVARLSQKMSNELRELKEYLVKVSMFHESPARCAQVAYLHNSIHPEEMYLTGGSYFKLNMPLLVSLAGSIITYSVILVQTSDSVDHQTLPRTNHSGTP
ncbi:uncharacterized protein LOC119401946 [Rhipicephalus sanguineus]|uniref:uncharacterized protein LOC119401946 n=1 Tax=Rhipicephalus sanguineus TaxID=34632 RepID=UPI0020C1D181|nr:uncharacterized protein LOC119401946 [Rhipicephalus sanguineus]